MLFPMLVGSAQATCDIEFSGFAMSSNSTWQGIAYSTILSRWVTCGALGATTRLSYSDDSETWTACSVAGLDSNGLIAVAASVDDPMFLAVLGAGTGSGAYSADGITWTKLVSPGLQPNPQMLVYGNGKFVLFGIGNHNESWVGVTFAGAVVWTEQNFLPFARGVTGVGYSEALNMFIAVCTTTAGAATTDYFYSYDGSVWSAGTMPVSEIWRGVQYNGRVWIAYAGGSGGSSVLVTSSDGINWTVGSFGIAFNWYCSATNAIGTMIVDAADLANACYCSKDDGATWTSIPLVGSSDAFQGIASDGVRYGVVKSTNGLSVQWNISQDA